MAVESAGLAASIAGIVSLGLKVVGGIIKYVDAVENRQEELEFVRRQSKALNATLVELDSMLRSHGQPGAVHVAVAQSMQLFETELGRLQALYTDLADSDPLSRTARLENRKKKVVYAFKRPRIQELGLRLQKAGDALQLALNVLGLQVSRQHTDALAAVELSSQDISSTVSLVRSEVAAIGTPIVKINDQLCLLQGSIDSNTKLLVAQNRADQGRNNDALRNIKDTNDIVLHQLAQFRSRHEQEAIMRHQEVMKTLQDLQKCHDEIISREAVVRRLAGKPALLKEISDEVQPAGQIHYQLTVPDLFARRLPRDFGSWARYYPSRPIVGRVCTCPRLQSVIKSKWIQLGHASFSSQRETVGHWSGCPMAKMSSQKRMGMICRYNALVCILKTAVKVSFAMTTGAGGFSISPNFTCIPTVDHKFDPAFRIIHLIGESIWALRIHNVESFMIACIKRLIRLIDHGKVSTTAVDRRNMSLMHYAILALNDAQTVLHGRRSPGNIWSVFVELVQMLLAYGVAAFTFDLKGMSPLVKLKSMPFYDASQAVIDVLVQANSENHPLVLDMACLEDGYEVTRLPFWTMDIQSLYGLSSGFAEVCECGPLTMAVIKKDVNAVERMLIRAPAAIAEIDVFGQTPFHLAAANPPILKVLLKYRDRIILDRRDISGFTALEIAMIRSSDFCDNGRDTKRCHSKSCGCCLCVDLFLGAECDVRMQKLAKRDRATELHSLLLPASELARRKYVYHMEQRWNRDMRSPPFSSHASTQSNNCQPYTELEITQIEWDATGSSKQHEFSAMPDVEENMSWVFLEINDPHLGALFYHHGFRPQPSCLNHLLTRMMNYPYLHWLISHGVDPSFRSLRGPASTKDSPKIGLFGAHFVFYFIPLQLYARIDPDLLRPDTESWDTYMALTAGIWRENLTDGCQCSCTTNGCSPFTWMMKKSFHVSWRGGTVQTDDKAVSEFVAHYSRCGSELTWLTCKAAIRYATFEALGLAHTCCDPWRFVYYEDDWVDRDDVNFVNEEQAPFLEFLEDLVGEFEHKAVEFLKTDTSGHSSFPQFWTHCWKVRIEEELERLEGNELTDAERRGAEEIGVRWTDSQQEAEYGNPYSEKNPEYWFYELDKICPEYAEPWPKELCRVSELP